MILDKGGKTAEIIILIILILGIFLVWFMSLGERDLRLSSQDSCEIKTRAECMESNGGFIVMGLSSQTNAHGQDEVSDQDYPYVLCCNLDGTKTCDGGNRILRLFSSTNSHAEIPDRNPGIYNYDICYGSLECMSTTSNCPLEKSEILSLSSETNSHIGKPGDYLYKICCNVKQTIIPYSEEVYWADNNGGRINKANVSETIRMYLVYSEFKNKEIVFEILEDDPVNDVEIRTIGRTNEITANTDNNGSVFAEWTITHDDYNRGKLGGEDGNPEYYFKISVDGEFKKKSNNLNVNISTILPGSELAESCKDYLNKSNCEDNSDKVGIYEGIYEFYDGDICEKRWNGSGCSWNGTKCNQKEVIDYNPENPKDCSQPVLPSCEYSESSKPIEECNSGEEFYELIFTPQETSGICETYSRKVYCNSGEEVVELPFFNGYGLVVSLIIIELIYLILKRKK